MCLTYPTHTVGFKCSSCHILSFELLGKRNRFFALHIPYSVSIVLRRNVTARRPPKRDKKKKAHHLSWAIRPCFISSILKTLPIKDTLFLYVRLSFLGLIIFILFNLKRTKSQQNTYLVREIKNPAPFLRNEVFKLHRSHSPLTIKRLLIILEPANKQSAEFAHHYDPNGI